jgi:hypothetical protein
VIDFGIFTEVIAEHFQKAWSAISVTVYTIPLLLTDSGIITLPEISVEVALTDTVPELPSSVSTVYVRSPMLKVSVTAATAPIDNDNRTVEIIIIFFIFPY